MIVIFHYVCTPFLNTEHCQFHIHFSNSKVNVINPSDFENWKTFSKFWSIKMPGFVGQFIYCYNLENNPTL